MSRASKSKLTNLFTILVLVLTAFQGLIPTIPVKDEQAITIISAIVLFLVSALTCWKQYVSIEIDNKAIAPTLIVVIVATFGALNELLGVFSFSELAAQWIRFSITFITMVLNLVSKSMWPTSETKTLV